MLPINGYFILYIFAYRNEFWFKEEERRCALYGKCWKALYRGLVEALEGGLLNDRQNEFEGRGNSGRKCKYPSNKVVAESREKVGEQEERRK